MLECVRIGYGAASHFLVCNFHPNAIEASRHHTQARTHSPSSFLCNVYVVRDITKLSRANFGRKNKRNGKNGNEIILCADEIGQSHSTDKYWWYSGDALVHSKCNRFQLSQSHLQFNERTQCGHSRSTLSLLQNIHVNMATKNLLLSLYHPHPVPGTQAVGEMIAV